MKFRPDTSFPFLAASRKAGVSYETALAFADSVDPLMAGRIKGVVLADFGLDREQGETLLSAWREEAIRRREFELEEWKRRSGLYGRVH